MKRSLSPIICVSALLWTAAQAHAQVIVDNFPSANGFSSGFITLNSGNLLAQSFTSGPGSFSSVDVTVQINATAVIPLRLGVFTDFAQTPNLGSGTFVTKTPSAPGPQSLTFANVLTGISPNTRYWVVLGSGSSDGTGSDFFWFHALNDSRNQGEGTISGGSGNILQSSNSGAFWQQPNLGVFSGNESYIVQITGNGPQVAAPEPGSLLLALAGGAGLLVARRRRNR